MTCLPVDLCSWICPKGCLQQHGLHCPSLSSGRQYSAQQYYVIVTKSLVMWQVVAACQLEAVWGSAGVGRFHDVPRQWHHLRAGRGCSGHWLRCVRLFGPANLYMCEAVLQCLIGRKALPHAAAGIGEH